MRPTSFVIASHGRRQGLTDDYLTVAIADETLPRGTRFMAVLERRGGELVAVGDGAAWAARGVES